MRKKNEAELKSKIRSLQTMLSRERSKAKRAPRGAAAHDYRRRNWRRNLTARKNSR